MNISFITSYYGTGMGGADISTKLLVDGLIKKRVNVDIINIKPSFLILKRILLNMNVYDCLLKRAIKKRLKKAIPDLIHVHDLMLLPSSVEAAKKLNIPVIVTVRDYRFISNLPILEVENDLIKKINEKEAIELLKRETKFAYFIYPFIKKKTGKIREALNKCNKIIAISNFLKKNLINNDIKKEIITIYNPCPDWKPAIKKHEGIVLFTAGRLEHYKGFHILINSVNDIIKEYNIKNIKLIIAGAGNYEKQLKELANKLNLNDYINFTGRISYDKIKEDYFDSDIIIFQSIWPEPLGRLSLEAISAGKPIIASNIGGIPEIVNNKTGILVKPNDKEELTEAILKLIKDEKLKVKMGKEANRLCDKFSQEKFVKKIVKVYNEQNRVKSRRVCCGDKTTTQRKH